MRTIAESATRFHKNPSDVTASDILKYAEKDLSRSILVASKVCVDYNLLDDLRITKPESNYLKGLLEANQSQLKDSEGAQIYQKAQITVMKTMLTEESPEAFLTAYKDNFLRIFAAKTTANLLEPTDKTPSPKRRTPRMEIKTTRQPLQF